MKFYTMLIISFLLLSAGVLSSEENVLIPYRDGNKCGYAEYGMKIKVKPEYEACGDMIDGMASVMKNGKFGFINNTGKTILLPIYTSSTSFKNGFAVIELDGQYTVINSIGDPVIPFTDYYINSYSDGAAIISKNYTYGLSGDGGNILLPVKYAKIDPAGKSLFIAAEPGAAGSLYTGKNYLYNNKGIPVIKDGFDLIYPAANGFMKIKNENKWGYLDPEGNVITPAIYENIRNIKQDGTACFKQNGKWGIINRKGKILVEPVYDDVEGGDGTIDEIIQGGSKNFIISKNGDYGIISVNGDIIAKPVYMMISYAKNGFFVAYRNVEDSGTAVKAIGLTLLDSKGSELFKPDKNYNIAGEDGDGLIPAGKLGSYGSKKLMGYINHKGESVISMKYDEASGFSGNYAIVKKDGLYGIIDTKGKIIEEIKYEELTRSTNYPALFEGYLSGVKVYLQPGGKHYWK